MINDPQQEIDLVLLDVYMQQDSGLDLLPTIRESGRAIDVIMITRRRMPPRYRPRCITGWSIT